MSGRPIARRTRAPLPGRRTRSVKRASAGLSAVRAGAALAMLASAAAIYGVGASSAFDYAKLQVDGLQFTDGSAVEATLAERPWPEPVRAHDRAARSGPRDALDGREGARRRPPAGDPRRHPRGAPADPHLAGRGAPLPGRFGRRALRAPGQGDTARRRRPPGHRGPACGVGRPVGRTRRSTRSTWTQRPVSPRSSRPTSGAGRSRWASSSTTTNGFVLETRPKGWSAVFGFYTPSLRTTDLIPGQVRLLRSLLVGREQLVDRVILATETDGTYTPRATPKPSPKPKPSTAP